MKKLALVLLGIFLITKTHAAGNETFNVDVVGCTLSGSCFAVIKPNATLTTCSSKSQIRFSVSSPSANFLYTTLLTAFTTGKKVRVALTDNCIDGFSVPEWLHVNNL